MTSKDGPRARHNFRRVKIQIVGLYCNVVLNEIIIMIDLWFDLWEAIIQ